jgi:DNA-binding CsgD family transcriptional regulator/Tfp pilus assembly protein PilF
MRAYAIERLEEAAETTVTREAHARFYLSLVELAEPELTGRKQEQWFERLDSERENLRSAIEWSLAIGATERALRLTGALAIFWRVRGHFSEGRGLAEAALAASNGKWPAREAKTLWAAGFMALMANDPAGAIPPLEESLSHFSELGDLQGRARALLMLGNSRLYCGDPTWRGVLEESAALAREATDPWCLSLALFVAGYALTSRNELPAARPLLEESLQVARMAQEKQGLRAALIGLGKVTLRQGDYASAEALLREALAIADELGEGYGRATVLENLAELTIGRGEYVLARECLDEVFALSETGPVAGLFTPLVLLGSLAYADRDLVNARRHFDEAIARAGHSVLTGPLHGLAQVAADEGDPDTARRLYEEALEWARKGTEDRLDVAAALHGLGDLARDAHELKQATTLHNEALILRREIGAVPGIAASLEAVGGLAAVDGRYLRAAHLLGAAAALRLRGGYARMPPEAARYEADLKLVRESVSAEDFDAAWDRGSELSAEEAARDGIVRRRQVRGATGWDSLTAAEQKVAALASEGLTNRAIAEHLFITPATVKNHLAHIYSKLGVARRGELWTADRASPHLGARARGSTRGV